MSSRYVVVQYLPDAVRDERINVGVVAFGNGMVRSHFLKNWARVRGFVDSDLSVLKRTCRRIGIIDSEDEIRVLCELQSPADAIQFTSPAGSLLDTPSLLFDAARRYLTDPSVKTSRYRKHSHALSLTKWKLETQLELKAGGVASKLIQSRFEIPGAFENHQFDLGLCKGDPIVAVKTFSFETPNSAHRKKLIDASAWAIDDVKRANSNYPIAVVLLPPKSGGDGYDRAKKMFGGLGATVVEETDIDVWAAGVADDVAKKFLPNDSGLGSAV